MKKVMLIILSMLMICMFTGCSSNNYDEKIAELEEKIAALEKQVKGDEEASTGFTYDEIVNGKWAVAVFNGDEIVPGEKTGSFLDLVRGSALTVFKVTSTHIYVGYSSGFFVLEYIRDGNMMIISDSEVQAMILMN